MATRSRTMKYYNSVFELLSSLAPVSITRFNVNYGLITWMFTTYLFSTAALTTVIDRLADIYGLKKMLPVFQCNTIGTMLRLCTFTPRHLEYIFYSQEKPNSFSGFEIKFSQDN
jgi:MFS family permease